MLPEVILRHCRPPVTRRVTSRYVLISKSLNVKVQHPGLKEEGPQWLELSSDLRGDSDIVLYNDRRNEASYPTEQFYL